MPKRYTEIERDFILALTLATQRPFTSLEPIVRGLAQHGCLSFLGPGANDRFATWTSGQGYRWAKRYGWELSEVETEDCAPLPAEEDIDDQILRDRLKVKNLFLKKITESVGDPHKNSNAFLRITDQIEAQIARRMTRHITARTAADLVLRVLERFGSPGLEKAEVLEALAEEMNRYRFLPAAQGAQG